MSEQILKVASTFEERGKLNPDSWKTTVTHRGKNRMKITFKLNQEEAVAFKAFQEGVQPDGLSEENFVKSIFFLGLTTLEQNVTAKVAEALTVEDGEVSLEVPEDLEVDDTNDADAE